MLLISWQQRSLYVSFCRFVYIIGLGQCPSGSRYSVIFIDVVTGLYGNLEF